MSDVRLDLGPHRALLVIDRPQVRNAVGVDTIGELEQALDEVERWQAGSTRAVALLVTGGGRSFVSGGDLRELRGMRGREPALDFSGRMQRLLNRLEDLPIPVLAAIDGPAIGGGAELALACDLRVLAEDAYLSFAQARMGVVTGWGGGPRLVDRVGWSRALGLLSSGARLSAPEARAWGLADWVAPPGQAITVAEELAGRMAALPPLAIRALKSLLQGFAGQERAAAQEAERVCFAGLWETEDHDEAIASLFEDRAPRFEGR
jgi:enoyl-CoA hydratase